MNLKNRIILSRGVIAILSILLSGFAYNTYVTYTTKQQERLYFENEKQLFLSELNDMTTRYDSARIENTLKIEEISTYKDKIKALENKVLNSESTINNLLIYRKELEFLKEERNRLFKIADSLKTENNALLEKHNLTENRLKKEKYISSKLAQENVQYQEAIKKASSLKAANFSANGIRIRSTGSLSDTYRAERVESIKVSFTLEANLFAPQGKRIVYIQVLDPKNNILGNHKSVAFKNGQDLIYSSKEVIHYKNKTLNTTFFIAKEKKQILEPGTYFISVFLDDTKIGTTQMLLK